MNLIQQLKELPDGELNQQQETSRIEIFPPNNIESNLEQQEISKKAQLEENSDEYYCEPTVQPEINRHNQMKKYEPSKRSAHLEDSKQNQVPNNDLNPKTLKDIQSNYLIIEDVQGLGIREIFDKYKKDFTGEEEKMTQRCLENQTILQTEFSQKSIEEKQEEKIMKYLKINSKKYQNVIDVSEIARGGESIVFRLDYAGVEEVVIKKSVVDTNLSKNEIDRQLVFTEMMSEAQQLKFLKSDKYIAQVNEEIIEYDPKSNLINDYLVIVERARFSLNDLLMIWNDEDIRSRRLGYNYEIRYFYT
eukprot:403351544